MKKNTRIKFRYIFAALLILSSAAITPACIKAAYEFRGYSAIGGEYLIILLGIIAAHIIIELGTAWDGISEMYK